MAYVPPQPSYDIFPNDYLNWNFAPPAGNFVAEAPAGTPRYGVQQYPGGGGVPVPVPSTRAQPQAPVPAPVERTFSASSSATLSSSSSQSTPSGSSPPSSVPSSQDLAQFSQIQGGNLQVANAPQPSRRRPKRIGPPRRRGPNKRHAGSGYVDMMSGLPDEVQNALQQEYSDCCEIVKGKDPSTVQKHRFTKRHFNKVDPELQRLLPAFTCPAFVGLHEKCKSAKGGRYDSTERHCNNCPGFQELRGNSRVEALYPFAISMEEFEALQKFRKTLKPGKKLDAPELIQAVVCRLYTMMTGTSCLPSDSASESQPVPGPSGAEESTSPSPPPTDDPSSSAQPPKPETELELLLPAEPMYDVVANDGAVAQQAAAAAWLDAFAAAEAFAQGPEPPLERQAQYGLYPDNNFTWPDANFDPASFGPFCG